MAARPINPERFLSRAARRWVMDPLKQIAHLWFGNEDRVISMAGGMPSTTVMPFKSMEIALKCPGPLRVFRQLVVDLHAPPTAAHPADQGGLQVHVTAGNTEAITKVFELVLDPGDYILIDEPCYTGILTKARNLGLRMLGVTTDEQGLVPAALRHALSRWSPADARNPASDIPRLVCTVPHASNPTGSTTTLHRRQEIYEICREYDLLILEDDPYYYLMYDHRPLPSLLSMDEDGRVIRLDSFSKILAPGFRCGIMSGHGTLLAKLLWQIAASQSHPNNLAQYIYHELFLTKGIEGFLEDLKRVHDVYRVHRDALAAAVNKYMKDLVEFTVPSGGMFIWMKILGLEDTADMIRKRALDSGVLVLPGSIFLVDERPSPYVRVSFATSSPEEIHEGIQRFATMIKNELKLKKTTTIEALE